jgi:hypothetical protein
MGKRSRPPSAESREDHHVEETGETADAQLLAVYRVLATAPRRRAHRRRVRSGEPDGGGHARRCRLAEERAFGWVERPRTASRPVRCARGLTIRPAPDYRPPGGKRPAADRVRFAIAGRRPPVASRSAKVGTDLRRSEVQMGSTPRLGNPGELGTAPGGPGSRYWAEELESRAEPTWRAYGVSSLVTLSALQSQRRATTRRDVLGGLALHLEDVPSRWRPMLTARLECWQLWRPP